MSRSSCTTSFTPCCSILCHSYGFFQGCPCPLLDVINVLHPGAPSSSFPRYHSENARLNKITPIVSACISKESHFCFDNLVFNYSIMTLFIFIYITLLAVFNLDTRHLKLTFRQYPAIHTNYIISRCTTLQYNHNYMTRY